MALIVSRQKVTITIPTSASSATATISVVDTTRTAIFWGNFRTTTTTASARESRPRITLANGTTLTATRGFASAANSITLEVTVIELSSVLVKSVQRGTVNFASIGIVPTDEDDVDGGVKQRAAISSVDLAYSSLLWAGSSSPSTANVASAQLAKIYLANSVVTSGPAVFGERIGTGVTTLTVGFNVVEWQPNVIKSIQQVNNVLTGTGTTGSGVISLVDTSNSIVFFNGLTTSNLLYTNSLTNTVLSDPSTLSFARIGTASTTRNIANTVVEFTKGVLLSTQNIVDLFSGASDTQPITTVNDNNAILSYNGNSCDASTDPSNFCVSSRISDQTTVTNAKIGTGVTVETRATIFEFADFFNLTGRSYKVKKRKLEEKQKEVESLKAIPEAVIVEAPRNYLPAVATILHKRKLKL